MNKSKSNKKMASFGDVVTIAGHYCLQSYRTLSGEKVAKDVSWSIDTKNREDLLTTISD